MVLLDLFATEYGRLLLYGWLLASLVGLTEFWRNHLPVRTWLCTAVLSLVLCVLGARMYYILVHDVLGYGFEGSFFVAEPYYHAFCGAVLGAMLAAVLAAKLTRISVHDELESLAVPGLTMIAFARAVERMSDFGWGDIVQASWMQHFPFGVFDTVWEEWHFALFNVEALVALVLLVVLVARHRQLEGVRFSTALVWWSMAQVFCESFRVETIKWGFVRVQQVQCAIFAAAVLLVFTLRARGTEASRRAVLSWVVYVLGVAMVVFLEFAIDKCPWPVWLDYVVMAGTLVAMGWSVQRMLPTQPAQANKPIEKGVVQS